jgi:hypothetical protein
LGGDIRQVDLHAAGDDLRVGEHLRDIIARPGGHARRFECRQQFLASADFGARGQQRNEGVAMFDPACVGFEAFVLG